VDIIFYFQSKFCLSAGAKAITGTSKNMTGIDLGRDEQIGAMAAPPPTRRQAALSLFERVDLSFRKQM
jgi:hypothetical protein